MNKYDKSPNMYSVTFLGFFQIYDSDVSYTFHFRKKITEPSVIFLRNGILILNGKEDEEIGAICFEFKYDFKKTWLGFLCQPLNPSSLKRQSFRLNFSKEVM